MISSTTSALPLAHERTSIQLIGPALVGAYFAVRVCLTFLFFQSDPQTGAAVSVTLNLALLVCTAIYSFGPGTITLAGILKTATVRLVFAYLALTCISLIWSETSSKPIAFIYWMTMAADVFLVIFTARANNPSKASEALFKGYIRGVLILSFIAWCAPTMQDLRLGDDEFLTPNAIGFECAIGTLLCQYFAPQSPQWKWFGAILALTLLRSISKTSIIAFLVAEIFFLLRTTQLSRKTKLKIASVALFIMLLFSGLMASYYTVYTNAGNQAETLTGRTGIWISTIGFAVEEPWLGHGFHSFRTVIQPISGFLPWHAHNELLQLLFAYGIVGIVLVTALYFSFYRLCKHYPTHPFALTGTSLLVLVLVRGLTDTERFDISFPLWALTAVALLITPSLPLAKEDSL